MSAFAFKLPAQIERNGHTVSVVDAEDFIICNMEDASVEVNLRDAETLCAAINNHDKLLGFYTEIVKALGHDCVLKELAARDALIGELRERLVVSNTCPSPCDTPGLCARMNRKCEQCDSQDQEKK